jgi:UDP-N-acetylglucosamine/UDP-N-acetylgalactosamine 4-epimerase
LTSLSKAPLAARLPPALDQHCARWLVTGGAGFIGSHLIETLLGAGQEVVTLDNFATGRRRNLDLVRASVGEDAWKRHRLIEADIRDPAVCAAACEGVQYVLHQAALGSVPRSIADPLLSHAANVNGTLNMLVAARDASVERFVYASSSSVYGDHPALPKVEDVIGQQLSPYAVTKYVTELYASVFARSYGLRTVGLRYFNVFGARQDPAGPYAAVIPRWVKAMLAGDPVQIFGDGETSRDFCYVKNVVQMNLLAALTRSPEAVNRVYNVAVHHRTSLNMLFGMLRDLMGVDAVAEYREFRPGDVRHSLADVGLAQSLLGYAPTHDLEQGLREALPWYLSEYGDAGRGT